ncbi:MAG TPA: Gfo/Idh/MocA family oxidoreductase [Candidatus Hydrogenedentes bacterium]|nr:Gfo/Idh/MocA family oxidoreductase [Candidatus Hydrogenedentota bacterium]
METVDDSFLSTLAYRPVITHAKAHRIGVIGAGRIAQQRQIPCYRNAGLEVVAAADVKQEALDRAAENFGITRGYLDYRDLLAQPDIDIVDICTNTFPRKQITLDALAARKHVLSEKPFARNYADAVEIVEAADASGVQLAVHQPTRWYYPCAIARELIMKGYLGDVFYIELRMHGNQDTIYYEDPVTRWHTELKDHIFVEWGAHHFDLCRWFAGGETPRHISAFGTVRGNEHFKSKMAVSASCDYASGIVGCVSMDQASRFPRVGNTRIGMNFRVEGTQGVVAGDMVFDLAFESRINGGISGQFDFSQPLSKEEDPFGYMWCASVRDGHLWPMAELIRSIHTGEKGLCSGRDNLHSVASYLAAMKSDELHRPVGPEEIVQGLA